ncbi:hypothetical protein L198_02271 [Cryptococcus wingfieldii CBS 7118]|uniref:Zn(2)-C6 fungal-type domain-containing protein n=1 Tax=Cryptococcus wingfieldii CBS 7118 TaxID=1295528 RepID=A0A1E3JRD8_9TREE|nr:hypothetical protein L198_02271 [Cryptococcus wingfieldii CBS 7118]ODO03424.1 hypothetical protein L198_02271 [Cryptococcus wingfieldii CBS 7118]
MPGPLPSFPTHPISSVPTPFASTSFSTTSMTHGLTINTTSMLDPVAAAALQHSYGYAGNYTVSPTALHGAWAAPMSDMRGPTSDLRRGSVQIDPALQDARDLGPGSSSASSAFTSLYHTERDDDSPVYDDDESLPYTSDIYDRFFQNERNAEMTDGDIMPEEHKHEHDSQGSDFEFGRRGSSSPTRGRGPGRGRGRGRPPGSLSKVRGGPGSRGGRGRRGGGGRGSRGGHLEPKSQGGKGGWTRNPVACTNCQRRHVRCEGGPPCQRCQTRKITCVVTCQEGDRPLTTSVPLNNLERPASSPSQTHWSSPEQGTSHSLHNTRNCPLPESGSSTFTGTEQRQETAPPKRKRGRPPKKRDDDV